MICPKCKLGEMNPINVSGSILECICCNFRRHIHHEDLNVNKVDIDFSSEPSSEIDFNSVKIINNSGDI